MKRLLAAITLLAALPASAQLYNPGFRWRTIETVHFRVHYHQGEETLAAEVAAAAERAHLALTPVLGYAPRPRTELVLSDDTDDANGSATPVPYNIIRLYAVPPDGMSELASYRDWVTALVFHEYVHILHLDNVGGVPDLANHVFGKLFVPNGLVPGWIAEGLAVAHEADGDPGVRSGRNQSAMQEMYARALTVEAPGFPRLDEISNPLTEWPLGNVPYLMGGRFMAWLEARYGQKQLAWFLRDQGSRIWPYAPSWSGESAFGQDFQALWKQFRAGEEAHFAAQLQEVRRRPVTAYQRLTFDGGRAVTPRWAPDGASIVYRRGSLDERSGLRRISPEGKALGDEVPVDANGNLTLTSGDEAVVAIADVWHEHRLYDDLWRVTLRNGRRTRLTDGGRATDPAFDPASGLLAFVKRTGPGEMALVRRPLAGGAEAVALARPGAQVFAPALAPGGRRLAVELHEGGRRDVVVLDGGREVRVTEDAALDLSPSFTPDGKWLVFSSNRSGIFNVYAWPVEACLAEAVASEAPAATTEAEPAAAEETPAQAEETPAQNEETPARDEAGPAPAESVRPERSEPEGLAESKGEERTEPKREPCALRQVTNVETGAFQPSVSPDGRTLLIVSYSRAGYDLATLPFNPTAFLEPAAPLRETVALPAAVTAPVAPPPSRPYSAWSTLAPTWWFPVWGTDAGGNLYGAATGGMDVLARHAWAAQAWWSVEAKQLSYNFAYQGGWSWPTFDLSSYRYLDTAPGGPEELQAIWTPADVGATFTFTHLDSSFAFRPGWRGTIHDVLGTDAKATTSEEIGLGDGFLSELTLGAAWSNARRYVRSISAEEGTSAAVFGRLALPELGSDVKLARVEGALSQYLRIPYTRHGVLALRAAGGAADGSLGFHRPFTLGGVSSPDLVSVLLLQPSIGANELRGYPSSWLGGTGYALANAELRFPIAVPERGYSTWPIFLRRVHGAVFGDLGDCFDLPGELAFAGHSFSTDQLRLGAGGELRLEVAVGYYAVFDVRLGLAHAFGRVFAGEASEPGVDPVTGYFTVGQSF
ncbi:MAG: BamA/TamA family outer membrane protein [Anaeromyxobacter sp.]